MKKLVFMLLVVTAVQSQSITSFVGYKSGEIDFTVEKELIYGIGVSIIDTDIIAKRVNKYDLGMFHQANTDVSPSVFLLLGGEVDQVTVVGKLGMSYVDQSINGNNDGKKFYSAVGIQIGYRKIFCNFDNCNSLMIGYKINL
jgi:hypothetical protein